VIYFTSDTHYFHRKIIEYSKRPFRNLEEMHKEMVRRWNERVGPEDTVVHLGDFSFGSFADGRSVLERLNGRKVIVLGNHDRSAKRMMEMGFEEAHESLSRSDLMPGLRVFMRHKPPVPVGQHDHQSEGHDVFLCGHVHELWARRGDVINVGVDVSDFRPLTLAELLTRDR
jgi:calcineurin-like phosphoesterase family protein